MADPQEIGEFSLIERYFRPLSTGTNGALGLADDAGFMTPQEGQEYVMTCDALVQGVHFLADADPADIGYKALAVNISDLCAKGARPLAYLLAAALDKEARTESWMASFARGLKEAQDDYGCGLLGGDTVATPGPVVISITAIGELPTGTMVHRSGAGEGDLVYVTGSIGDAALGLEILKGGATPQSVSKSDRDFLSKRHRRPSARTDAIEIVRKFTTASMDISDGLAGDFMKLVKTSRLGGVLNVGNVPLSSAAQSWLGENPDNLEFMVTGGDDYELLVTVPSGAQERFEAAAREHDLQVTCIGHMTSPGSGFVVRDPTGKPLEFAQPGYNHF